MDEQRKDMPASYQLHSWARRQRNAAIRDMCRRAMGAIWRCLFDRRTGPGQGAGAAPRAP